MIIEARAFARAGLLGNPSDGYFGKTISISVKNFGAHVSLFETPELRIEAQDDDRNVYRSIFDLVDSIGSVGYYGGERLIKAAIKRFCEYCRESSIRLPNRNFTIRFRSNIPRQVGLAGSSAIVTAAMRALMRFYEVEIPQEILPTLILNSETKELKINAGLQDRVIQVYEGCVYMDFAREVVEKKGHGRYERLDPKLLPPLYLAYRQDLSKVSGEVFNDVRTRFEAGDPHVIGTLKRIAELAEEGREVIQAKDYKRLNELIDENFDNRTKIMKISDANMALVETARKCGASASFPGSGGAIIGMYKDDEMLTRLMVEVRKLRARVIKPYIL